MADELRFDGRVVVVTGAGNGLGRSHALEFARRGAKVVVNDLGGSHTGEGASSSAADKVVAEIKEAGGEAAANYDSVEDGDKIVQTALDKFGRIDVLINNAGILRDVSFQKMTDQDWDLVYRVHVRGAYKCSHAAWPHMREQKYGRIVFTASAAGIYGNFGQANYAMAKLGLVGFGNTLAIEGRKNNVIVNTIAPIAGSRMTETVLPQNLLDALKPEYVTSLVVALAHEGNEDTGGLYEVGGGFYGKLRWERTAGKLYRLGRDVTAEDVKGAWKEVSSFEEATHPEHIAASLDPIMKNVEAGQSKGGNKYIDVDAALGYEFPQTTSSYDERDLAIYALGIGAAEDPSGKDLRLVYELHGEGMVAMPSYGVIPAINEILKLGKEGKTAPGMNYGLDRVLHGEQYLELTRPLPTKAKLKHRAKITDIFDKGSEGGKKGGAVVITTIESLDEDGDVLIKNQTTTFVRGAGGWGGDRGPAGEQHAAPDRAPDKTAEQKVDQNQALLYRLSGDWNPLHADPGFAKAFGFERPILHGLCTFGYATRHVLAAFAPDGDYRFFKSIKVRFADPVVPGETLVTEMWKESGTKILFRVKAKERDKVVISNAAIELFAELPKPKAKKVASAPISGGADVVPNSADVFAGIAAFLAKSPGTGDKVKTVYAFKLSNPESVWTVDLSSGNGSVAVGETTTAGCTLEISDADFMDMCSGKADAMKLFTTGKLKIGGNVMASQKLDFLKKVDPADVMASAQKRGGGGGASAASATAAAPGAQPVSADVFGGISRWLAKTPGQGDAIKVVYAFKLSNPESVWTIDLSSGNGSVSKGEPVPGGCTLEISEADFMDMCTGKADAMKLFTTGKLKIGGNVMASQKLDFLKKVDHADVAAAMKERLAGGGGALKASAAPTAATTKEAAAPRVIAALQKRLGENKALASEVGAIIELRVTDPDATYALDFKTGKVESGAANGATSTLTISDADLAALASGAEPLQALFQRGRLRVDGDVAPIHRLGFFQKLGL